MKDKKIAKNEVKGAPQAVIDSLEGKSNETTANHIPEDFLKGAWAEKDLDKDMEFDPDYDYGDRMPFVGEVVLFTPNPSDGVAKANKNDDAIPAIVTRVWSNVCVNLKIFPDCGPVQDRTSVVRKDANPASYHFNYTDL